LQNIPEKPDGKDTNDFCSDKKKSEKFRKKSHTTTPQTHTKHNPLSNKEIHQYKIWRKPKKNKSNCP
ncbi:MAG: hypothetical protein ABNH19_13660, partial [Dokdonia sp.]|jgi:hypothetical protein